MADFPAYILFLLPLAVSTLPALIAAILWGGRGVKLLVGAGFAALLGYLIWGFGFGGFAGGTGMELLGLFLVSIWWAVGAVWSWVCYLLVRAFGGLPVHRQGQQG